MPICIVAINAHLQPRNLKLALTTVGKSTGSAPSMSSCPLREWTDGDGWIDERMPRYACFLHLVTTVFCVIESFGLPHCSTTLHFVFDNTLPRSANRLLILALLPIREHEFQSHTWYCPKIVLPALPGEMGCQSTCLIMSYYPLCPQTGEGATPVSMWSWSIHNHFPVTAVVLSGDGPASQTSHFRKGDLARHLFDLERRGRGGGGGLWLSEGWIQWNSKQHWIIICSVWTFSDVDNMPTDDANGYSKHDDNKYLIYQLLHFELGYFIIIDTGLIHLIMTPQLNVYCW